MSNDNAAANYAEDSRRAVGKILNFGGSDGTSDGMDVVDAKIAAAEARTDTKFAQVMGELKRIDEQTKGTKTTVIVTGIAVLGLSIAAMAWGGQMFGNGLTAQPIASAAVQAAQSKTDTQFADMSARYDKLDTRISGIESKLSTMLDAIQRNTPKQ